MRFAFQVNESRTEASRTTNDLCGVVDEVVVDFEVGEAEGQEVFAAVGHGVGFAVRAENMSVAI